jgi:hypothetical protein
MLSKWRNAVNPTEWMMPLYKYFGANHPVLSAVVVFMLSGGFFTTWWVLTGKEYRAQRQHLQSSSKRAPLVDVSNCVGVRFTGGAILTDDGSALSIKNSEDVTFDRTPIVKTASVAALNDDKSQKADANRRLAQALIDEYTIAHPISREDPNSGDLRALLIWVNAKLKERGENFELDATINNPPFTSQEVDSNRRLVQTLVEEYSRIHSLSKSDLASQDPRLLVDWVNRKLKDRGENFHINVT